MRESLGPECESVLQEIARKKQRGEFTDQEREKERRMIQRLDADGEFAPHELRTLLAACQ